MNAFLYAVVLQWKMDLRSKFLFVTYYLVPFLFFLLMSGIFTSVMPEMEKTLVSSMIIMGTSMGAFIGLPSSLAEIYGSKIKKVYQANGAPLCLGWITMFLSAWMHMIIFCVIILVLAPILFKAAVPSNLFLFFASLTIYITASLSLGSILGLLIRNQAKLTMIGQLVFLPSIMLSGIMFSTEFLPDLLKNIGLIFPASWGYRILLIDDFQFKNIWYLLAIILTAPSICYTILKKQKSD